jgi:sensor histidine kinase YesM
MKTKNRLNKKSVLIILQISLFLCAVALAVKPAVFDGARLFNERALTVFILTVVQAEIFVLMGLKLFGNVNFGKTQREITWNIILRYAIFYVLCLIISLIVFVLFLYVQSWFHGWAMNMVMYNFIHIEFKGWFVAMNKGLLIGPFIFVVMIWQSALRQMLKFAEENLIFQNQTLKNQINPHFLFNSLNTLSSLVVSAPAIAEQFINKLSSIYRYILENSPKDKVPLSLELAFINDYFYLHQIRDEDKIAFEITIINPEKYEIMPVSLQLLIENAFKHNMATRERPLKITIYREGDFIVVKNNLQKMASQPVSAKTGLKNLSERVRFTTGKALIVEETVNYYIVKIPLIL